MNYKITYDDGSIVDSWPRRAPARLPEPGDVYVAKVPILTLGGSYQMGDRFTVLERTRLSPHKRTSSLGNLIIKCKLMSSVWTEFDGMIANGHLELVVDKPSRPV